jgi:inhibitor of KinA sporulation pathway (predicted exonuclease)
MNNKGIPLDVPIILFDIEYTAWDGSKARQWSEPWEHREIIQIAALKVAPDQGVLEMGSFECLIKPKHNRVLSPYIINLTGITQADVETRGIGFAEASGAFFAFCEDGRIPSFCYGEEDPIVFHENYQLNGIEPVVFPAGMHDIREILERGGIDTRLYTSGTVHQAVGAEFTLAAHNALNDVLSLAVTLRQLTRTGRIGTDWANFGPSQDIHSDE